MTSQEKQREYHKKWVSKNPEFYAEYKKQWNLKNRDKVREHRRKYNRNTRKYLKRAPTNIYIYLFDKQNGVCAICGVKPQDKRLAVDHCHQSGEIRGLLCSNCNLGIGLLQDNPMLLTKAADYLNS